MEKKKKSPMKSILTYGLILLLAVVIIYWFVSNNEKEKQITYTEFQQMVESGEVAEIDVYGYTVRIRKVDGVDDEDFPKKLDAYCTFMSYNELTEFVDLYNAKMKQDPNNWETTEDGKEVLKEGVLLEATYSFESESWFSKVLPYVSIIIVVVLGIFLFRSMSGNNKGFGFGKSKAKLVVSSNVRFQDVAGADEEKQELQEVVEFLKNPARFTELGARIPKGILLVGNPGTGKTLLAKAVAGESKVPFFSISGSDFVDLYGGVGASRVRDLFDTAKANSPCIGIKTVSP